MKIAIAVAAIAITVTNDNNEVVLDYSIENYKLVGDVQAIAKAGIKAAVEIKTMIENPEVASELAKFDLSAATPQ